MSRFEDHLWREFVREHGNALAQMSTPAAKHIWRGPRLVAGTGLGLAGVGAAVALVLSATSTSPAFAVTRNRDGTVTISIKRSSGIAGANARLQQLGIRATVTQQTPGGCQPTVHIPMGGQGAPESAAGTASAHWRIDPSKVPAGHRLVLTPPPTPPPAGNSGNSGNSGNGGSEGQVYSSGSEGPGPGSPPAPGKSGNSGNSGSRGSGGQVWTCGTEGPGTGHSGPPPSGNSGNSGASGNS